MARRCLISWQTRTPIEKHRSGSPSEPLPMALGSLIPGRVVCSGLDAPTITHDRAALSPLAQALFRNGWVITPPSMIPYISPTSFLKTTCDPLFSNHYLFSDRK